MKQLFTISMKWDPDQQPNHEEAKDLLAISTKISRGFVFAQSLAKQTEATYAGKGIQRGMVDTPIFWYKPEGAGKYRVIFADLVVKDADAAAQIENAQALSTPAQNGD